MVDGDLDGDGSSGSSGRAEDDLDSGGKGGYVTRSTDGNDGYETAVTTDLFGTGTSSASRSISASSTKSFSSKKTVSCNFPTLADWAMLAGLFLLLSKPCRLDEGSLIFAWVAVLFNGLVEAGQN